MNKFNLLCNTVLQGVIAPVDFHKFYGPFVRVISYLGGLSSAIDPGYSTSTYGPSSLCAGVPLMEVSGIGFLL